MQDIKFIRSNHAPEVFPIFNIYHCGKIINVKKLAHLEYIHDETPFYSLYETGCPYCNAENGTLGYSNKCMFWICSGSECLIKNGQAIRMYENLKTLKSNTEKKSPSCKEKHDGGIALLTKDDNQGVLNQRNFASNYVLNETTESLEASEQNNLDDCKKARKMFCRIRDPINKPTLRKKQCQTLTNLNPVPNINKPYLEVPVSNINKPYLGGGYV